MAKRFPTFSKLSDAKCFNCKSQLPMHVCRPSGYADGSTQCICYNCGLTSYFNLALKPAEQKDELEQEVDAREASEFAALSESYE